MDPVGSIPILLLLVLLCAMTELGAKSVLSQNQSDVKKRFPDKEEKTDALLAMLENGEKLRVTADLVVVCCVMAIGAIASVQFGRGIMPLLERLPELFRTWISYILVFFIAAVITVVLGRALPERLARKYADTLCFPMLFFLKLLTVLFAPLRACTQGLGWLIARMFGVRQDDLSEEITEGEIRQMIDEGQESGSIEESEKEMIHSIFELDDRMVSEIITHRTDVTALNVNASLDEVLNMALESGFSRIPVYKDSLDDVVGLLYTKDLVKLLSQDGSVNPEKHKTFQVSSYMREALYVPETINLKELFEKIKTTHIQMAIVIDEYGGTLGLVTMEDLIESIMGSINDEFDGEDENESESIRQISENEFLIDGLATVREVEETVGQTIPNNEECETIGGLAVSMLGYIPEAGEHPEISLNHLLLQVVSVEEHRVKELHLTVTDPEEEQETSEPSSEVE